MEAIFLPMPALSPSCGRSPLGSLKAGAINQRSPAALNPGAKHTPKKSSRLSFEPWSDPAPKPLVDIAPTPELADVAPPPEVVDVAPAPELAAVAEPCTADNEAEAPTAKEEWTEEEWTVWNEAQQEQWTEEEWASWNAAQRWAGEWEAGDRWEVDCGDEEADIEIFGEWGVLQATRGPAPAHEEIFGEWGVLQATRGPAPAHASEATSMETPAAAVQRAAKVLAFEPRAVARARARSTAAAVAASAVAGLGAKAVDPDVLADLEVGTILSVPVDTPIALTSTARPRQMRRPSLGEAHAYFAKDTRPADARDEIADFVAEHADAVLLPSGLVRCDTTGRTLTPQLALLKAHWRGSTYRKHARTAAKRYTVPYRYLEARNEARSPPPLQVDPPRLAYTTMAKAAPTVPSPLTSRASEMRKDYGAPLPAGAPPPLPLAPGEVADVPQYGLIAPPQPPPASVDELVASEKHATENPEANTGSGERVAAEAVPYEALDGGAVGQMKVAELRAALHERGLSTTGKKADLLARLLPSATV